MIYLYSGTPGSGKSLHTAEEIYYKLKFGKQVLICNFPINMDMFKPEARERFIFKMDSEMTPQFFIEFAEKYWEEHPDFTVRQKEGHLKIYIDEAQRLFNAREWQKTYEKGWNNFFSLHRHLGYDIILITQYDRMLDRQIRALIEYEYVHRKIANIGLGGKILNMAAMGGLFVCVQKWYPQREKIGVEMFRYSKKYDGLYDTHMLFEKMGNKEPSPASGDDGAPANQAAAPVLPT